MSGPAWFVITAWLAVMAAVEAPAPSREAPSYPIEQAPADLRPALEAADAAILALQRRLSARLQEELHKGGARRAVDVCRDEAQILTAETARAQGIRVGRTSQRLRNPGNTPPAWAERFVAAAGPKAASVQPVVVDLGDHVGVLRPLPTGALCTQCHGSSERVSAEVKDFLRTAYPDDRAVGFEEGDLRGFAWAEAPRPATSAPAPRPGSPGALLTGAQLFAEANPRCTVCHSVAGKGNPQGPLDGVGQRLSREDIRAWIRQPSVMAERHGRTRKPAMVAYPEFEDEELEALVEYLAGLEP